jgi:sugar phosphate permease
MIMNGLLVAALSLTSNFNLGLGILFVSAFFGVMVGVGSQSLTQTVVSDQMRGRALSVWYTITRAGPAIGAFVLGSAANRFGFEAPLLAAGLITATVAAATLFLRNWGGPPASPGAGDGNA